MKHTQSEPRNILVSIVGILLAGLFLYIGVGVWFVAYDSVQGVLGFFARSVISILSFGLVYLSVKLIITGSWKLLKRYLLNMLETGF